jgi:hypothetical protein
MNTGKVVAGGLVAGLVFNIGDAILNAVILAEDFRQAAIRLNLDPAAMESLSGILPWVVIDLLYGVLVVWTYAAIRPRFGPGPMTAVTAGLVPFVAATLLFAGVTSMGMFPLSLFIKQTGFSIVTFAIGSVAGAWVYTEP